MKLLVLGNGKTGSLVSNVARERGHGVTVLTGADNLHARGLNDASLRGVDMVIDFTRPDAVLENIEACARAGASMVVGTTGWYGHLDEVRQTVAEHQIGFIYASNFSVGMNLFFKLAAQAAAAAAYGYTISITEKHHAGKKDAPSGTAITLQQIIARHRGGQPEIKSIREGDFSGIHTLRMDSSEDTITLMHDAHTRRGFATGALRAAEWLHGKKGFYDFSEALELEK